MKGRLLHWALAAVCLIAWGVALLGSAPADPVVHLLPVAALILLLLPGEAGSDGQTSYQRWLKRAKSRR